MEKLQYEELMNEIKSLKNMVKEMRYENKELKAKTDSIAKQTKKETEYSSWDNFPY